MTLGACDEHCMMLDMFWHVIIDCTVADMACTAAILVLLSVIQSSVCVGGCQVSGQQCQAIAASATTSR